MTTTPREKRQRPIHVENRVQADKRNYDSPQTRPSLTFSGRKELTSAMAFAFEAIPLLFAEAKKKLNI